VRVEVAKCNRSEGRIVVGRRAPVETLGAPDIDDVLANPARDDEALA
jgi:hypothetical protein